MLNESQSMNKSGFVLFGTIFGRSRRFVGDKNTEVVTYRINDGTTTYFIDHWNPDIYYGLGCNVSFPILIKPYIKNANAYLNYAVKVDKTIGTEF